MAKFVTYEAWKRAIDVALALVLTVATAPLLLLAAALVKLTSRGPWVYSQVRLGRDHRPFTIFKIRTMYHECERLSGPKWSTDNDPRVTLVGKFLRRTHLDELPQLWNVLRGEMSLVGPRPERPEFASQLEKVVPDYCRRLEVLPGVTGLAQVNLPPDTDQESVRRKLIYDVHYVDNLGFWIDARLILATAIFMLGMPFAMSSRLLGLRLAQAHDDREVQPRAREAAPGVDLGSQAVPAWRES